MKIFVSSSGPRSAAVAEALKEYLPMINNPFDLWPHYSLFDALHTYGFRCIPSDVMVD